MKKLSIVLLSAIALGSAVVSCSKDEAAPSTPTSIEITVKDNNGVIVKGATVSLYDSADSQKTLIASGTTDANGKCLIDKDDNGKALTSLKYGFSAGIVDPQGTGGCKYGEGAVDTAIPANKKTSAEVVAKAEGYVYFINSTTSKFNLYIIVGDQKFKLNGDTPLPASSDFSQQPFPLPLGSYTFKYIAVDDSGAEVSGSDIDKPVNVTECAQVQVNFGA